MTNNVNPIAFNVGSPTVAGPNGGFINGVKFTGPSKSGKFWIAATSANAKAGSTREPNSKEKAELLAAFHTAIASNGVTGNDEQDAWVKVVDAANTKADKPANTDGGAQGGNDAGAGDGNDSGKKDDAGGQAGEGAKDAAEGGAQAVAEGEKSTKGGDFSGGSDETAAAATTTND